jgi:hypothetical protein
VKEIFILEEVGEKLQYYFSTLGGGGGSRGREMRGRNS